MTDTYNSRTITGSFFGPDGDPLDGFIEFYPNAQVWDGDDSLVTQAARVQLDGSGAFTARLPCTDLDDTFAVEDITVKFFGMPEGARSSGWAWTCREPTGKTYWFLLYGNTDSTAPDVGLGDLVPLPVPPPLIGTTVGAQGPPGDPGPAQPFTVYVQVDEPSSPAKGDIWIDEV